MSPYLTSTLFYLLHYTLIHASSSGNLLIYHSSFGTLKWSPSSASIKISMIFVRTLVQEKIGFRIDQPDPRGGTTSTGSVARGELSDESGFYELYFVCYQY